MTATKILHTVNIRVKAHAWVKAHLQLLEKFIFYSFYNLIISIRGCETRAKNPGPVESQILRKKVYLLYQKIFIENTSYHFHRAMHTLLNHISMKLAW